jgi:hypothetical protein
MASRSAFSQAAASVIAADDAVASSPLDPATALAGDMPDSTEPTQPQTTAAIAEPPASNFAKLADACEACTPEEQWRLLNQNNAVVLRGDEGLQHIRGFHVAALRDSDRQTRIRELRALLTAFGLTVRDLSPPAGG